MQFSTIVPLCFCDARILRRRSDENPTPFSFALVIAEQQHLCEKFCANCLVSCTQKKDTSFLSASSPLPCDTGAPE